MVEQIFGMTADFQSAAMQNIKINPKKNKDKNNFLKNYPSKKKM